MSIYRYFLRGVPEYLARHYWWAYLWRPAIWFFDHQFIINAILFGQYQRLLAATLDRVGDKTNGNTLQLTCVYGSLSKNLCKKIEPLPLFICDVADGQLDLAKRKLKSYASVSLTRMNAERLGFSDNTFTTVIIFFLLHEMPHAARIHTLQEAIRVTESGGRILLTEYGYRPQQHWLYRFWPSRFLLLQLEPFLGEFWQEDIELLLSNAATYMGKRIERVSHHLVFNGFYRVNEYRITASTHE